MTKFLTLAVAFAAVGTLALAQAPQAPKPVTRAEFAAQANALFATNDANHDGFISLSEMQAAQGRDLQRVQAAARAKLQAEFKQLDTNHDGQLSLPEFMAIGTVKANQTPQQLVQQLDTNHDGKVSAEEFRAARLRQFDQFDANHDGILSPAEMQGAAGKK
jgi:Ca2+-binding EF-hand superfamily protein